MTGKRIAGMGVVLVGLVLCGLIAVFHGLGRGPKGGHGGFKPLFG